MNKKSIGLLSFLLLFFFAVKVNATEETPRIRITPIAETYVSTGNTLHFTAVQTGTSGNVSWQVFEANGVSPTNRATITQNGDLTANSAGNVAVVATSADGSVRDSYAVFILDSHEMYYLRNLQTGKAITANSAGSADLVIMSMPIANNQSQLWTIEASGNTFSFQNVKTGQYITQETASKLTMSPKNGNDTQKFTANNKTDWTIKDFCDYYTNNASGTATFTKVDAFKFSSISASNNPVFNVANTTESCALSLSSVQKEDSYTTKSARQEFQFVLASEYRFFDEDDYVALVGKNYFSSLTNDPTNAEAYKAFDGSTGSFFEDTGSKTRLAYVGIDFGEAVTPDVMRVYVRPDFDTRAYKGYIQASNDKNTWTIIHDFAQQPFGLSYTDIYLKDAQPYRYYRYVSPRYGCANISEIQFYKIDSGDDVPPIDPDLVGNITSPNGKRNFKLFNALTTGASYEVLSEGISVIKPSALGLNTSLEDFTKGLVFDEKQSKEYTEVYTEAYNLVTGKNKSVVDTYKKALYTFTKNGHKFQIEVRIFNDGVGIRYLIDGEGTKTGTLALQGENTQLNVDETADVWAMNYKAGHDYEYLKTDAQYMYGSYIMPFMVKTNNVYALLFNVNLDETYAGMQMQGRGKGRFTTKYTPQQTGEVKLTFPFTSPWRAIALGSATDIAQTNLAENLADASKISDTSWIQPGVTSWTWYNNAGCESFDTYKNYVDLSSKMGWDYVLLDEGWQERDGGTGIGKTGYYGLREWIPNLITYAKDKNVSLLVWAHYKDLLYPGGDSSKPRRTVEEVTAVLKTWADLGIKGIKPDFFDSEAQSMLENVSILTQAATNAHLMINYHGLALLPGLRRTYPNVTSIEAVYGEEQNRWGTTTVNQNTILPFIRNSIGAMDYTPAYSTLYGNSGSRSYANSTALSVVFENGLPCLADTVAVYDGAVAQKFFQNLPSSWDESKLLAGEPSDWTLMARRNEDDWYVGAITDGAREYELSLDFLKSNRKYTVEIYEDGLAYNQVRTETKEVTNKDRISLSMLIHGGAALHFTSSLKTQDLEKDLAQAKAVNLAKYTEKTAQALRLAIEEAEKVLNNIDTTQDDVDKAQAKLEEALDGLVLNRHITLTQIAPKVIKGKKYLWNLALFAPTLYNEDGVKEEVAFVADLNKVGEAPKTYTAKDTVELYEGTYEVVVREVASISRNLQRQLGNTILGATKVAQSEKMTFTISEIEDSSDAGKSSDPATLPETGLPKTNEVKMDSLSIFGVALLLLAGMGGVCKYLKKRIG